MQKEKKKDKKKDKDKDDGKKGPSGIDPFGGNPPPPQPPQEDVDYADRNDDENKKETLAEKFNRIKQNNYYYNYEAQKQDDHKEKEKEKEKENKSSFFSNMFYSSNSDYN